MLVIRTEQMKVFKEAALLSFRDQMVAHLREFSPPLFKACGEKQIRAAIYLGVAQASSYGFTFRGPVRLYLEMMLLFGSHFDTDPQYPWAAEILTNQDPASQMQRALLLHEKVMDYRQKVAGAKGIYTIAALKKTLALAQLSTPLVSINTVPSMLKLIEYLYPQKAAYVGVEALETLARKGIRGTERQQFSTDRGKAVFIGQMFTFGHECGVDPLYPWIAKTIQEHADSDSNESAKRLETASVNWLKQFLVHLGEET